MRTLITALLLTAPCAAQVPTRSADLWLEAETARLKFQGKVWGANGQFVRGTGLVGNYWLKVEKTMTFPQRFCVAGDDLHQREVPGFLADDGFPLGQHMIVYSRGSNENNWNGNFATNWVNLTVNGNRRAQGVKWGAAQGSSITNCSFVNMFDNSDNPNRPSVALEILPTRGQIALSNIEMSNHDRLDDARTRIYGTGLLINRVVGLTATAINSHSHEFGVDVVGSHEVLINGLSLEKTKAIRVAGGSSGVQIRGIDFQMPQHEVLLDLTGSGTGNYFEGRLRHCPKDTYVLGPRGRKWPLVSSDRATKSDGVRFACWVEYVQDDQRRWQPQVRVQTNPIPAASPTYVIEQN